MNLETWRQINYLFADLNYYQLGLTSLIILSKLKLLKKHYLFIAIYIIGTFIFESVSKYILKVNSQSSFFKFIDYFYIIFEATFLYLFIYYVLKSQAIVRNALLIIWSLLATSSILIVSKYDLFSEYFSLIISISNTIILSFALFHFVKISKGKPIFNQPEALVFIIFIISYTVLIFVYVLLPKITNYSRILANQLIVFKHVVSICFYLCLALIFLSKYTKKSAF